MFGDDIKRSIKGTGLYFEAVVAQKCLESTYGTTKQATDLKNLGGVTWTRNFPSDITKPSWSIYGKFPSYQRYFDFYVKILKDPTKKYITKGVFTATSPEQQVLRMNEAGWCEDPDPKTYAKQVNPIIEAVRDLYKVGKVA